MDTVSVLCTVFGLSWARGGGSLGGFETGARLYVSWPLLPNTPGTAVVYVYMLVPNIDSIVCPLTCILYILLRKSY